LLFTKKCIMIILDGKFNETNIMASRKENYFAGGEN
jgi:hypothetical protein